MSLGAVNRLEGGEATPRKATARKIIEAFQAQGVKIVDDEAFTGAVITNTRRESR